MIALLDSIIIIEHSLDKVINMPQIQKVTTYKFDELPEKVQQEIIDKNRDIELDGCFWYDHIINEYIPEILGHFGFSDVNVFFRASYCQGDGSSIEGCFSSSDINIDMALEYATQLNYAIEEKDLLKERLEKLKVYQTYANFKNDSTHYCHNVYAHDILIDQLEYVASECEYEERVYHFVQQWYNDIEELLIDLVGDFNSLIMSMLYDEINYLTSDEYIKELLLDLDNDYTINGDLF